MESTHFDGMAVDPCRPIAPWIGGKRNLAKRLTTLIDGIEGVDLYAEPFVGMGGIFLRRRYRPKAEAINDLNRDVANLFRIVQRHYQPFLDMIRWKLATRTDFERLVKVDPETLTDLERAARFLYLARLAFGGRVAKPVFGVSSDRPARFDVTKLVPMLEDVHERLSSVTIECLPYAEFIQRYDRPGALFYLDPPYWSSEGDYGNGLFERADFERLADVLKGLSGRFVMSLNDVPEVREIFGRFRIERVETTYTVARGASKKVGEVIIQER